MDMQIGEKIRTLRKAAGLSQQQLADELGVSTKSIQRYERGKNPPGNHATRILAAYFSVSADYLLGLTNERTSDEEG